WRSRSADAAVPRRTVRRGVAGWNVGPERSPSRGRGEAGEAFGNRAAGRIEYRATRLRSIDSHGTGSSRHRNSISNVRRDLRCQRSPPLGDGDLALGDGPVERQDVGGEPLEGIEMAFDRAHVAPDHRP